MNFKKYQNLISIISILLIVGAISFYFFNSGSSLEDILEQSNVEIIRNGDGFFQIINAKDFDVNWGTKDDPSLVSFKSKGSFLNIQLPLKEIKWKREGNKIQANHGPFTFSYELIKNKKGEELFYIPKPFMVDSNGNRSENVEIDFKDGFLIITPNQSWLQKAKYPVRIDPTFKLSILDLHSHPQTGDNWRVRFETEGEGDLKIIPNDQATIDDIEFTSLECNGKKLEPEILEGDVIYYPNWSCNKIAEVNHYVKKAAPHKLRFEFRGEVKYARNSPDQYLIYDFTNTTDYDFTNTTDNSAYEKGGSLPSSPTDYDNEAGSSDYTAIDSSNNSRWQTDLATTSDYYNSQIYNFKIDESTSTLSSIDIEWEGYGSSTQNTIYLKAYNYTNSTWTDITSLTSATTTDQTLEGVVSDDINDYLNGSSTFTVMAGVKAWICGDDVTFTYNGSSVTYGTVATSGECWMDRNLGASRVAQSYDDSEAYGDLFQWGRPDDGHQERSSGETSTLASADHPGHSDFIKSGSSPYDWRDPQNDNMWNTDGSGSNDGETCPEGWRVPSETEWSSVSSNWSDRSDAFNSVLK